MNTVVAGFALLLTISMALALGIVTAYGSISAILHLFGTHQHPGRPTPTLVHSPTGPTGD